MTLVALRCFLVATSRTEPHAPPTRTLLSLLAKRLTALSTDNSKKWFRSCYPSLLHVFQTRSSTADIRTELGVSVPNERLTTTKAVEPRNHRTISHRLCDRHRS